MPFNLPLYVHHIFLHAPIVLSPVLAIIGTYWFFDPNRQLENLLRYLGDAAAVLVVLVISSGLLLDFASLNPAYNAFLYRDHRDLGLTTLATTLIAAVCVEWGLRSGHERVVHYGALMWWVVTLSALATGHYGGAMSLAG